MDTLEKLTILADAAKYDAACTSSGGTRTAKKGYIGNTSASVMGCCHSFSADGRCITLLKVLLTNRCAYDCKYCVNRRSNDVPRAAFTPEELADLTIQFYRRNYIEGLFLSSAVLGTPDYTTELMIRALVLLREERRFNGYIHAKAIPGTSSELVERLGLLADRLSVNIELPSEAGLRSLAPDKSKAAILKPMGLIRDRRAQNREELVKYRHASKFAPAGQSTQLIVGATADTDLHILRLTQGLYDRYQLKLVFYSAYVPVAEHTLLPSLDTKPPLLREHRLYQADWLLRFYGFRAEELLDADHPDFDPRLDPKCHWALLHPAFFPVEVNTADYETLLRVPGIGTVSARRILSARRTGRLRPEHLRRLGVVMKRAQFFLTASGKRPEGLRFSSATLPAQLATADRASLPQSMPNQLSLFDSLPAGAGLSV
ncbi:MAG: putative DNA modification/repair radical SAM protein [Oscillibacter sp.]|nr:putative DNA modification/repair radical SAM protein [Oscillibacter sp.]